MRNWVFSVINISMIDHAYNETRSNNNGKMTGMG